VWDSDGDSWSEIPNPGENISIISTADIETNIDEIYIINITNVPPNCDKSNITFKLKIDADNVTFLNPFPSEEQWQGTNTPQCRITISDPTTKVNASSIQYQISTDNGTTWENDWINVNVEQEDTKSINCVIKPILKEGRDNLIKWRAKDILGNGFNESEEYRILVDLSNVTFTNATPSSDKWQTNLSVVCNITIIDNLSGVNASSIEFRFSTDGIFKYDPWQSARQTINDNIIHCSVNLTFEEGEDNYIQWRAKDIVRNGPYISEDYQIRIKINYPPATSLLSPSNGIIIKTLTPELIWKGTDPDGDTPIRYDVYLSIDENKLINLDDTALLESGFTETKYKLESPLSDNFTYYWTVIPNDGIIDGNCNSGIWHFKIDTTVEIPIVTLVSPINNSNISTQTPNLSWNINYSNINIVTYTMYIDTSSQLENYTENYKFTSYVPSVPLLWGATYYWTVIPIAYTDDGKIKGECKSGIWSFTIELGFVHIYGVDLKFETQNLTVKQGDYISTNITITNTGNSVDMINLNLEKGILDANVALEHLGSSIRLNSSEKITLKLEIKTSENTDPQNYTLTITAISNGALSENQDVSVSKSLQLKIIEKELPEGSEEVNLLLWVSILIIIIIIILIISLFIYRKKKAAKIPTLRAEILHAPPAHLFPGETPIMKDVESLSSQPTVSEQLATQKVSVPSLAPTPMKPQLQLPQATLSTAQKLNLLQERLLRGEVDLETYKELKTEIESSTGGEIPEGEIEELPPIDEPPLPEPIATPPAITPQVVAQPPQPIVTPPIEEPAPSAPPETPAVKAVPSVTPAVPPPPQPTVTPVEPTTAIPKVAPTVVVQPPPEPKPPEQPKQQSTEDEEELEKE
jgi:hypothetical protein